MITKEDILNGTNRGLDIILHFYPQAWDVYAGTKKHFRIRNSDDTPSASLKEFSDMWKVTDFGDAGKALSPFDICMREMDMKFSEAVYHLAGIFNISGDIITPEKNKPEWRERVANEDEKDGDFSFELKDKFTDTELAILGPKVEEKHCKELGWYSVKYYQRTKEGKTKIKFSTENYPIFMRECRYQVGTGKSASFYKFYEPLNHDKRWRFFQHGDKPKNYIHGLLELQESYAKFKSEQNTWPENEKKLEDRKPVNYKKLDEVFICSGERDALCVKALGYRPIWKNSETDELTEKSHKEISLCVDKIYNIPDIDDTGVKKGLQLAMKFIDIYTVWLPDRLKTFRDQRGRPRKDFRDFSEIWPERNRFKDLLNMAMPVRFWEYTDNGKGQKRLDINSDYVTYFLRCNGFVSIDDKNSKTGKMFARIEGNVVREVKPKDIRFFLRKFVRDRYMPVEIRNAVNNSTRLSESNLDLDEVELNFEDYTPISQFFFFQNAVWEVKENQIKEYKPGEIDKHVWGEELIKHNVKRLDPAFKISRIGDEDSGNSLKEDTLFDIDINANHSSNFLRYLINASRIFWRKELEKDGQFPDGLSLEEYKKKYKFAIDGPRLLDHEVAEQKQHLINKIFCLGYLLHRYKAENRAWCIFAMDNKIGEAGDSNGGSGKSFCFKAPALFMRSEFLPGRNTKLTENSHIYENVTEHTDYVLIDDAGEYIDFGFFYSSITNDLTVNPKFNKSYNIPFDKAPKFGITSNFTLRRVDPSTERRILYSVFSDYYHQSTENNDYRETRTIYDDFNKNLFREDYSDQEWNADINFFVDCCQFYLSVVKHGIKIQPPLNNVMERINMAEMGPNFHEWAAVYFSEENEHCDNSIPKNFAFEDFKKSTGIKSWTPQRFMKALKAFCRVTPYVLELNPVELRGKDGRIIQKVEGTTYEMIYLRTKQEIDFTKQETDNDYGEPEEPTRNESVIPF